MSDLAAKIRNLFTTGKITRRDSNGKIQGTTRYGRTIEGKEFFPYGFYARAKEGTVLFFFEGGDVRSPVMLPISSVDGAPELEEGDAALWTKGGGWVIVRSSGAVELFGKNYGGLIKIEELKTQLQKNNEILTALLSAVEVPVNEPGNGAPSVFQTALKAALTGKAVGDFSGIENEKVKHGDGSA